ncbi:MAG: sel1 repeat family protein, partial [Gammaproteobacteria bacterium]|nr:sel1 repeat family protein [Gammaproteobacteria bacterium]
MLLLKTEFRVKSLEISTLYHDFLFVFFMLLFLSSFLFTPQRALASNSNFKVSFVHEVGYTHKQQRTNFSQAQISFGNQDYSYSARLLTALAENGHVQAQYLLATQYDVGLGVDKNSSLSFYWYEKA